MLQVLRAHLCTQCYEYQVYDVGWLTPHGGDRVRLPSEFPETLKRQHANHGLVASQFNCSVESWHLRLCLTPVSMSPNHKVSDAIQTGKAELTRTANLREVSDPLITKGHLGCIAKTIINFCGLTSFHNRQKKLTVKHSGPVLA